LEKEVIRPVSEIRTQGCRKETTDAASTRARWIQTIHSARNL